MERDEVQDHTSNQSIEKVTTYTKAKMHDRQDFGLLPLFNWSDFYLFTAATDAATAAATAEEDDAK